MFWRGVWGYLPANIVQGMVGFLAIILFTRLLDPADFGRYALAFSVMTLAHVAVFSWLEQAREQDDGQEADHPLHDVGGQIAPDPAPEHLSAPPCGRPAAPGR